MGKIEQLTQQALGSLTVQMGEKEAQEFLRTQFPDLSPKDARELTRPIPPRRRRGLQKISEQLEEEVKEVKVGDLDLFVKAKFPSLPNEERTAIIVGLTRTVTPRPPHGAINTALQELIHQAVENVTQDMDAGEAQHFLTSQFSRLTSNEANLLVQPLPAKQQAVGKVVGLLKVEAETGNPDELQSLLAEKLSFPLNPGRSPGKFPGDSRLAPPRPKPRPLPRPIPPRPKPRPVSPPRQRTVSPRPHRTIPPKKGK